MGGMQRELGWREEQGDGEGRFLFSTSTHIHYLCSHHIELGVELARGL